MNWRKKREYLNHDNINFFFFFLSINKNNISVGEMVLLYGLLVYTLPMLFRNIIPSTRYAKCNEQIEHTKRKNIHFYQQNYFRLKFFPCTSHSSAGVCVCVCVEFFFFFGWEWKSRKWTSFVTSTNITTNQKKNKNEIKMET